MSVLHLLFITLAIIQSYLFTTKEQANNYTRIKVIYKSPDYIIDDKEYWFDAEIFVTYNGNYTIYELPYHKTYSINERLVYDSAKYEYFICNENNKQGFLLKDIRDSLSKKIAGDSILAARAFNGDNRNFNMADSLKALGKTTIVREHLSENKFIDKYYFANPNFYDSAYFYYSNELRNIRFTISNTLDSVNDSKLLKVQYFIKHDDSKTASKFKSFYINSLEIQNAPSPDESALKDLFDRFIAQEKISAK
ncbi:hypothetical protein [Ferruginibacter profundus]